MADQAYDRIKWPELPESLSQELRDVLTDMQKAIDERLDGNFTVNGNLIVDGNLYTHAADRIKTLS